MNRYKCAYRLLKPISSAQDSQIRMGWDFRKTVPSARSQRRFEEKSSSKRSGIGVLYAQIADLLCDCPLNPDDGPDQKEDGKSR
ncbi:hypothetical protein MZK49_16865 [Ensifer sesbaniae]|uniref:hypothetical protein n=1 Tax=Ensifer sesbaniae TaxID=1214071 RepID=UPI0020014BB1|nr:hypothetical protein [Ensifer sesbaniae]